MKFITGLQDVDGVPGAVFRVPTAHRGDVHMCVTRSATRNEHRAVLVVDAQRLLNIWQQPWSGNHEVANLDPGAWQQHKNYAAVESAFGQGEGQPVPLPSINGWVVQQERATYRRWLGLLRRRVGTQSQYRQALSIVDGIARTTWLLAAGARQFPIECTTGNAQLLLQWMGSAGSQFLTIDQLIPARLVSAPSFTLRP